MAANNQLRPRICLKDFEGMALLRRIPRSNQGTAVEAVLRDAFRTGRAQAVLASNGLADHSWEEMAVAGVALPVISQVPVAAVTFAAEVAVAGPGHSAAQAPSAPISSLPTSVPAAAPEKTEAAVAQETSPQEPRPVKSGSALKGFFGEDLAHLRQ